MAGGQEGIGQVGLGRLAEAESVVDVGRQVRLHIAPAQGQPVGVPGPQTEFERAAFRDVQVAFVALFKRGKARVTGRSDGDAQVLQFGAGEDGEPQGEVRGARCGHHEVQAFPHGTEGVGPMAIGIAFHAEAAFSCQDVHARRDDGPDGADGQGVIRSGEGLQRSIVHQSEIGHGDGLGAVVNEPLGGGLHGFGEQQIEPGEQGEGREDELQVPPVFSEVHRGGEPVGAELVTALGDGGEQELLSRRVFIGAGLELQGVEQPVFNVGEVAPDDAGGLIVIQARPEAQQAQSGEEKEANGHGGNTADEQVEKQGAGLGSKASDGLQSQHDQPSHGQGGHQDEAAAQHLVAVVLPDEGVKPLFQILGRLGHGLGGGTKSGPLKLRPDAPCDFITC